MPDQVNVQDLEVFRLFRVAMLKFAQTANQSLANADSEIARTHAWLENEQMSFWQGQLRKRSEAVTKAKDALRSKRMFKGVSGRTPDALEEEKALAHCQAAVEQAQDKIKAIRSWLPKLEKASGAYRGATSSLNRSITGEIPQGVALLDRLAATLEAYMQVEAPEAVPAETADSATSEASMAGASMSRGGDGATEGSVAPGFGPVSEAPGVVAPGSPPAEPPAGQLEPPPPPPGGSPVPRPAEPASQPGPAHPQGEP